MNVNLVAVRQPFFLNVIVPSVLAGPENVILVLTWNTFGLLFATPITFGADGTRSSAPGGTFIAAGAAPVCWISACAGSGLTGISSGGNIVPVPIGAMPGLVRFFWIGSGRPSPICAWP